MVKLTIIGQFFGTSGYANHTRQLANALSKYHDLKIFTQLFQGWELQCTDNELKMINKQDPLDSINLIIDLPHNWSQFLNKKKNIGFLVYEGDRIPKSWIKNIIDERVSQVWVPSTHVYNAIKQTFEDGWDFYKNKIKIVPHGYDPELFYPKPKTNKINQIIFFCNKGFRHERDRGGVQYAIKAFLKEFNKDEAKLLVKINPAYGLSLEYLQLIINKYILESGKNISDLPEIMFNSDNLLYSELINLYNETDIFLNPTEGEAFSLPCLEAMACGKPVITTNFGGQIDYVNSNNGWLVDYELHEIHHEIIYEGINWGRPIESDLRKKMREAYETIKSGKEMPISPLMSSKPYTWDNSALKASGFLEELN